MSTFSRQNIGKLMATVFAEYKDSGRKTPEGRVILSANEEVINQATIQSALGRNFRITGIDSTAEAHNLATLITCWCIDCAYLDCRRTYNWSIYGSTKHRYGYHGDNSMAAVMLFTLLYYRTFGLIANAALMANLVLIIGVMSMIPRRDNDATRYCRYRIDGRYGSRC